MKETIIVYLADHAEANASSIAEYIGLKPSRTRDYLNELIVDGIVIADGSNRNRTYRLKTQLSAITDNTEAQYDQDE